MTNVNIADFGFAEVRTDKKTAMVGGIFSQVAPYYDQMNDIMSGGFHRCWKSAAVAFAAIRPGMTILDLACGSGDLATRLLPYMTPNGHVILADINPAMLALARRRLQNYRAAQFTQCNGESLPFAGGSFDRIFIAFGLRNITYRQQALAEMHRVLRPGGQCIIVEFSRRKASWPHCGGVYCLPHCRVWGSGVLTMPTVIAIWPNLSCAFHLAKIWRR